jgi:hypothetical protein
MYTSTGWYFTAPDMIYDVFARIRMTYQLLSVRVLTETQLNGLDIPMKNKTQRYSLIYAIFM